MPLNLDRKAVQVICALMWCIVAAGPVFGFAALKPVLIAQKVYHEQCHEEVSLFSFFQANSNSAANTLTKAKRSDLCSAQDLSLNFLFTLAAVVTNAASLLVGAILDRYGPRVTGIIGAILLFIASTVLSNSLWLTQYFDAYLVGYSTLALGGPFVFISCFHLANAFPRNSGLVLALLTGAFDSSSALFLIYRVVFFSSFGQKLNLSLRKFFTFYMVVPVFILACQIFIMPHNSYKTWMAKLQKREEEEALEPEETLAIGEPMSEEEEALIDTGIGDTASIDNFLPIPVPSRNQLDGVTLLNSINENLSRSLNAQSPNILTDQFAHQRSNSFNQKVLSSRRSSLVSTNGVPRVALSDDIQLPAEAEVESFNPSINSKVAEIHNTINTAISNSVHRRGEADNTSTSSRSQRKSIVNSIISDSISIIEQTKADEEIALESGITGALHAATIRQQVASMWFVLMALFTSIQMLRINYFVATIRSQEEYLLDDPEKAKAINEFFDVALPVGGLLSIPFIGVLLDNFKTITVLAVLLTTSLTIGIMGIIPHSAANYIGIMLMVVYRPFYYTAVSDYCAKVFGFNTFGTVYGAIICTSGLFNFVQTGLDNLTHVTFKMNPIPVNTLLTSLTAVLGGALLIFVHHQEAKRTKKLSDSSLTTTYGSIEQ